MSTQPSIFVFQILIDSFVNISTGFKNHSDLHWRVCNARKDTCIIKSEQSKATCHSKYQDIYDFQPDIVPKKKNKLLKTSATRTTSFFRKLNNGTKLR